MPRIARKNSQSCFYHVIVQGINKEYIFQGNKYMKKYKEIIVDKKKESKVAILAYCIMSNHAHFLLYSEEDGIIPIEVKSGNNVRSVSLTMYINQYKPKYAIRFSLVVMCILVFVTRALPFSEMKYLYFFAAELCTMMFLFIYWTEKKYRNVFLVFLVALTLIGGVTVNPIIKEKTEIVKPPEEIVEPV